MDDEIFSELLNSKRVFQACENGEPIPMARIYRRRISDGLFQLEALYNSHDGACLIASPSMIFIDAGLMVILQEGAKFQPSKLTITDEGRAYVRKHLAPVGEW